MLKSGAEPNLNAPFGSPLLNAIGKDIEIVRLLIKHGANVNYVDEKYGISPLIQVVKLRPETYASLKAEGTYIGAAPDILKTIRLLIDAGADVNHHDSLWNTPLRIATIENNVGAVQLLLKAGANVE